MATHQLQAPLNNPANNAENKPFRAMPDTGESQGIRWKKDAPGDLVPQSTYRFQFHKTFTLQDAKSLLPYLSTLGITHCYASPLLQARPGSMHGYDIVNHQRLNPEIGTEQDFEEFCNELHAHQMKLIVDIVPNHMGIGCDNQWWMDVLENGQSSEFAHYFDIDWTPLKPELRGKVLLPVLGAQYGEVLENGEFKLHFSPENGNFQVTYYDHQWPVNPNSYAPLLSANLDALEKTLDKNDPHFLEYQSIITALENLPLSDTTAPEQLDIRWREKRVIQTRLVKLCQKSEAVKTFIQQSLDTLNRLDGADSLQRLHRILEMQCYRLAFWRVASDEINYRRFFEVNDLASLNMQNPEVFETTHALLFQWVQEGKVNGFRIDHPDGLYDPAAYFEQLQEKALAVLSPEHPQEEETTLPLYLVAEKILAPHEMLPASWPIHGTSGYEFGNRLMGIYVNTDAGAAFSDIYQRFTGLQDAFEKQVYECKQLILKESLASELNVLASMLYKISEQDWKTRDFTLNNLRRALGEILAAFPVYRTYITPGENNQPNISKKDIDHIQWAVQRAKKYSPLVDISIFDFIHKLLLMDIPNHADKRARKQIIHFAMKFQQLTGPVMAKGMEDTCFYRYNRLTCLNEVGGEPNHFGLSVSAFHRKTQEQAKSFPHTMLNTSTHDSKRSEDVRARLAVLSEIPELWEKHLEKWSRLNRIKKSDITAKPQDTESTDVQELAPDRNDEYLIYQTLLGAWPNNVSPSDETLFGNFKERITQYILKACREAKQNTSWVNQNTAYEDSVTKFITELLSAENNTFLEDFLSLQKTVAHFGALNSLSQTLVKLTVPGVPDIYQGNESWQFNMVDPDNRRPINYEQLKTMQADLQSVISDITAENFPWLKLLITHRCLQYRRQHPELFNFGDYIPLETEGNTAAHVIAFVRQFENKAALIIAPRLLYTLANASGTEALEIPASQAWGDANILLPEQYDKTRFRDIFTGATIDSDDGSLPVSRLFEKVPFGFYEIER